MNKKIYFILVVIAVAFVINHSKTNNNRVSDNKLKVEHNVNDENFVNVYSSRKLELMQEIFDEFTKRSGIRVNVLVDDAKILIEKMGAEKFNTKADLFITSDIGNLEYASEKSLLQWVPSKQLDQDITVNYRAKDKQWYGLSKRARVIFYSKERVDPTTLSTYEELANPRWNNKVLISSSNNIYNQSLIASMIQAHGNGMATNWVKGIVANFARNPNGTDEDQLRAIAAGEGDIAIANTYYYARLKASNDKKDIDVTDKVGIFFPNQLDRGAHINLSGAGIVAGARRPKNALKLLEFMAGKNGQKIYALSDHEYPISNYIHVSEIVASWPKFKADEKGLIEFPKYLNEAIRIADREGWR